MGYFICLDRDILADLNDQLNSYLPQNNRNILNTIAHPGKTVSSRMDIDVNRLNRIMTEAGKYSGKEVILQVFGNPIPGCRLAEFAECRFDTESYPYMRLTLNRVSKDGKLHFLTMCHSINICGQEYAIVIEETERTAEASRFQFFLYFCDEIKYNATRVVPSDTRLRVFKLSRDIRDYFLAQKRDLEEAAIFLDERVLLLPELT